MAAKFMSTHPWWIIIPAIQFPPISKVGFEECVRHGVFLIVAPVVGWAFSGWKTEKKDELTSYVRVNSPLLLEKQQKRWRATIGFHDERSRSNARQQVEPWWCNSSASFLSSILFPSHRRDEPTGVGPTSQDLDVPIKRTFPPTRRLYNQQLG